MTEADQLKAREEKALEICEALRSIVHLIEKREDSIDPDKWSADELISMVHAAEKAQIPNLRSWAIQAIQYRVSGRT